MSTLHTHTRGTGTQDLLTAGNQAGEGEKPHSTPGPILSTTQHLSVAGGGVRKDPGTEKQDLHKSWTGKAGEHP